MGLFDPKLVLVRTTVATETQADAMAQIVLDAGAACVHVQRVRSLYTWQQKRVDEVEWLVEARTTRGGEDVVRAAILQGHPYDLPMVESWTVRAERRYADWAAQDAR